MEGPKQTHKRPFRAPNNGRQRNPSVNRQKPVGRPARPARQTSNRSRQVSEQRPASGRGQERNWQEPRRRRQVPQREQPRVQHRQSRPHLDYRKTRPKQMVKYREESNVQKVFKFLFNLFYYIVVLTIIMSATLFAMNRDQGKSYFGYRLFRVVTNSMAPQKDSDPGGFYAGDLVILTSVQSSNEIREKDIVTYRVGETGNAVLTHRVVKKMDELNGNPGDYLVTKGDANNSNDPPIQANRVIGKVTFVIPKVGTFVKVVHANFWPFLIFALSLIGFLLTLKLYLFAPRRV